MDKAKQERKQEYIAYIASPKWKSFRNSIIIERGRKCERCGEEKGEIHAHHLTYIRFMNELPEDIKLLCKPCHKEVHRLKDAKKKRKKAVNKPKKKRTSKIKTASFNTEIQRRYKAIGHYPMRKPFKTS